MKPESGTSPHKAVNGTEKNFGARAGAVIPQVWLVFSPEVTLKLGYAMGIDREPEDFARLALEVEF